jgi:hypothetical protein
VTITSQIFIAFVRLTWRSSRLTEHLLRFPCQRLTIPTRWLFCRLPRDKIAEVIQVESLVPQIPILEKEVSQNIPDARVRLVELRQALSDHVPLGLFDAFSVAAELECEKGRADALASGMEEKQNDIQQRRTVIALLADATAGFLSGIFLFGGADVLAGGADIIGNILQGTLDGPR